MSSRLAPSRFHGRDLPADLQAAPAKAPFGRRVGTPSSSLLQVFGGPAPWCSTYLPAAGSMRHARRLMRPFLPRLLAAGLVEHGGRRKGLLTRRPLALLAEFRRLLADACAAGTQAKTPRVGAVLANAPWAETFICRDCRQRQPVEGRVEYRCADCAVRARLRAGATATDETTA